jgi:hypothetical protein
MSEAQNTKTVQDAYAAFGRGDVETLLSYISDDVVWSGVYGAAPHVPTSGERRGKAAVGKFFAQVGEHVRFSQLNRRNSSPPATKWWRSDTTPRPRPRTGISTRTLRWCSRCATAR